MHAATAVFPRTGREEEYTKNYLDETLAGILVLDEFFFGRCFDWSKTPEGRPFWKEIDRKWWEAFKLLVQIKLMP